LQEVEVGEGHDAALGHLPQLDRLVVGRQQQVRSAAARPPHAVDLLLNLQGFEVVKLGLVALELGEVAVLVGRRRQRGPRALVRVQVRPRLRREGNPRVRRDEQGVGRGRGQKRSGGGGAAHRLPRGGALEKHDAAALVACG
jgi:hypothetical protein